MDPGAAPRWIRNLPQAEAREERRRRRAIPVLIPKYTAQFRAEELERGRRDFFYFYSSILGFAAYDKKKKKSDLQDVHVDLCRFLEGRKPHFPWNRALVCCFRGMGKSTITTIAYPIWRGMYKMDWSARIVENSSHNAKVNHFLPIVDLFVSSRRADYLQYLYGHRLPEGFEGWTSEILRLKQEDPLAAPFLSYMGISSSWEGVHVSCVILDDPEGADAEKSAVGNEDSYNSYQKSIALLKDQRDGQILIVCTPHGRRPLAYRIRDIESPPWQSEADNARTQFKVFWRPIVDEHGKSRWPERYPASFIATLHREPMANQQYFLRRQAHESDLFDLATLSQDAYSWADGMTKSIVSYNGFAVNPDSVSLEGYVSPLRKPAQVSLKNLRYFLHYDPLHKTSATRKTGGNKQRPAKAAITVVGVGTDLHAFVIDYWSSDKADLYEQAAQLFRFYCLYAPHKVTYESVGAQFWLKSFIETMEKQRPDWSQPRSAGFITGASLQLPRMSQRLVEAAKTNESKDYLYREALSPYINHGILHTRLDQDEIRHQLVNCLNEDEAVDLVDCLAQGPAVWSGPRQDILARGFAERRGYVESMVKSAGRALGSLGLGMTRKWGR